MKLYTSDGELICEIDASATTYEVNEVLIHRLGQICLSFARDLTVKGLSRDEVNEMLKRKVPKLESWRVKNLTLVMDAKKQQAPSFTLRAV